MAKLSSNEQAVLQSMAKGQFAKQYSTDDAVQWTSGTERLLLSFGSATTKVVEGYIDLRIELHNNTDEKPIPFEYYAIKHDQATAPDLSTTSILEGMMKEKRIFARGHGIVNHYKYAPPTVIKMKFFNVELEEDDYLHIVLVPRRTSGAAAMTERFELEHRNLVLD